MNQLLHFFTGSYSAPPNGWPDSPAKFKVLHLDVDVCAHLEAHTCHFVEVGWLVKKGDATGGCLVDVQLCMRWV